MIDLEIIENKVEDYYKTNFIADFPEKTIINGKSVLFKTVLIDFFADLGVMLSDMEYNYLLGTIGAYFSALKSYKENAKDKIKHHDRISKAIQSLEELLGDPDDYRHITMVGKDTDRKRTVHVDWNPEDYKTTLNFLNMASNWETKIKTKKPTREALKSNLESAVAGFIDCNPPNTAFDKLARAI